jgi:phosphoribosylaminoimidazole-succinocarboxamide synthase
MGDHDEDISREDIIKRGIVSEADYVVLEDYTRKLFQRGSEIAASRGLILVDTKYEFGKTKQGKIVLIDEIHTPDSSRYFYADDYESRQAANEPQKQLSKEFVRQWLISNDFQGLEGQSIPYMSDEYIKTVSDRYVELYENITGESFVKADISNIQERIETNVLNYLKTL